MDFLAAAVRYAQSGLRIIPVKPRGKLPLTQHGAHDATADETVIRKWWAQWPDANIGLTLAGLVAVDIDPRNGGDEAELPEKLPETCYARTGGGGMHYLYRANGVRYAGHPAPGIDVKTGAGAYIVVEPSVHPSGGTYCWLDESEPWAHQPAEAPTWLAQIPDSPPPGDAEGKIAAGGRNAYLTRIAGSLRRQATPPDALAGMLKVLNDTRCSPPLPDADVQRIAASVARYAPAEEPPPEGTRADPLPVPSPINWRALSGREPPARLWAIKAWLGFYITLMAGRGGVGKTLLAQMIGSALALGIPFIDEITRQYRVLFWGCEDDHDEFWRRQVLIGQHFGGVGVEAFTDNLIVVPRLGRDNVLVSTEFGKVMYTPRLEELREQAGDLKAEIVILDNAAQLFGINANDNHQVTASLNAVSGAIPGRATLLLAHPAKASGSEFSGGAAWENVARARLYLGTKLPDQKPEPDEEVDDDVRFLARRKANYTSNDWRRFTFRNGVLVPDLLAEQATGGIVGHLRDKAAERIIIDGLKRLASLGVTATDGTTSPRFLPRLLLEYKLADTHNKPELARAMRRLLLDGKLRRSKMGTTDNRHAVYGLETT